ncbi:unnamed protein product [Notodromas monacha]|uniref:Uncharacterized protein n=1 Tax=Notodromas monacha TaxID=399045 RepID=A0A7R9GAM3_9CRUS|nr:unnamed protein product [Notodromas monacha]CAG0915415.1 unnamed protein product [Notodromas monacha]
MLISLFGYYGASTNGFFRGFDPRPGFAFKGAGPLYGLGPAKDLSPKGAVEATAVGGGGLGGVTTSAMLDMSSTQALLNVVRNASPQNAAQLENYLRNVMGHKRAMDAAAPPAGAANPLDLSQPPIKKTKLDYDLHPYGSRDFKDLFGLRSTSSSSSSMPSDKEDTVPKAASPTGSSASVCSPRGGLQQQQQQPATPTSKQLQGPPQSPSSSSVGQQQQQQQQPGCLASCGDRLCAAKREEVEAWGVDQVCGFVRSIDICADYADVTHAARKTDDLGGAKRCPIAFASAAAMSAFDSRRPRVGVPVRAAVMNICAPVAPDPSPRSITRGAVSNDRLLLVDHESRRGARVPPYGLLASGIYYRESTLSSGVASMPSPYSTSIRQHKSGRHVSDERTTAARVGNTDWLNLCSLAAVAAAAAAAAAGRQSVLGVHQGGCGSGTAVCVGMTLCLLCHAL